MEAMWYANRPMSVGRRRMLGGVLPDTVLEHVQVREYGTPFQAMADAGVT